MLTAIDGPLLLRTLELITEIEEGRRTCEVANLDLLAAYQRLQERAPALNAVITELAPGERAATGPLHGVAVAVKDNIDVAGVVTTNASTVAVPPAAARDATVVSRLRAAGADLLCKTNLLEYAAGSVNPAYGMTYNPRDPSRTSGGSSSGSAALVAAGVVDYALGTDTGGSIRIPAAYCGIVGLKPTYGLVPVDGVFPLSTSLDHVGTLTTTVAQTRRLLEVLAGVSLDAAPPTRIGVLRRQLDDPDLTPGVRDRTHEAIEALAAAGFEIVDVDLPELELVDDALGAIALREAWDVHRERFEREADGYGPGTRALLELGAQVSDDDYRAALADKERIAAAFARVFADVPVLAGPTVAYEAPPEDPPFGTPEGDVEGRFTGPYNIAGVAGDLAAVRPRRRARCPAGLQLAAAAGERRRCSCPSPRRYEEDRAVRIEDCNWMQVEEYLQREDRLVIPLGSIEQHGYLSLGVDRILSERVSVEAAEPLGVLVLPSLPYGLTPYFAAYPGSPTLRVETYSALLVDLLDSLAEQGFRRFLFVNGHGGNERRPRRRRGVGRDARRRRGAVAQLVGRRAGACGRERDRPDATHASWFENFPWTRLAGVELPAEREADGGHLAGCASSIRATCASCSATARSAALYERPDADVLRVWAGGRRGGARRCSRTAGDA